MFYGRYDYPTGKFLWGDLRYQRVSEYNLQTFLNMKNSKLREEQIMSAKRDYYEVLGISRDADKNTIRKALRKKRSKKHIDGWQKNTTRIQIREMHRRQSASRKQQKPTIY